MGVVRRFKYKALRLIVSVRKKLKEIDCGFESNPPHPLFGLLLVMGGVFISLLGVIMLIFPGPGLLALAFGITNIVFGFRITTGYYNED